MIEGMEDKNLPNNNILKLSSKSDSESENNNVINNPNDISLQNSIDVQQNNSLFPQKKYQKKGFVVVKNRSEEIEDEIASYRIQFDFLRKVYFIITSQAAISFFIILIFQISPIKNIIENHLTLMEILVIIYILFCIACYLIINAKRELARKKPNTYIILGISNFCQGYICSVLSIAYSFEIVIISLILILLSLIVISIFILKAKIQLDFSRMYLSIVLTVSFSLIFLLICKIKFWKMFLELIISLPIGFFYVYETQIVIAKYGSFYNDKDYVFAAMDIYADILRLILNAFKLCGKLRENLKER